MIQNLLFHDFVVLQHAHEKACNLFFSANMVVAVLERYNYLLPFEHWQATKKIESVVTHSNFWQCSTFVPRLVVSFFLVQLWFAYNKTFPNGWCPFVKEYYTAL